MDQSLSGGSPELHQESNTVPLPHDLTGVSKQLVDTIKGSTYLHPWHSSLVLDSFYFGKYPGIKEIEYLVSRGITIFLNLTEDVERYALYSKGPIHPYDAPSLTTRGGLPHFPITKIPSSITYLSYPIVEGSIPTNSESFKELIANLMTYLNPKTNLPPNKHILYIHCYHGRGRSGLVANIIAHEILRIHLGMDIGQNPASRSAGETGHVEGGDSGNKGGDPSACTVKVVKLYKEANIIINDCLRQGHGYAKKWQSITIPPHNVQKKFIKQWP